MARGLRLRAGGAVLLLAVALLLAACGGGCPPPQPCATATPTPAPQPRVTVLHPGQAAPAERLPDAACAPGRRPGRLRDLPPAPPVRDEGGQRSLLVGRTLAINGAAIDQDGTAAMAGALRVLSEQCVVDQGLRYDLAVTDYYTARCPAGLADFPRPEAGPWGMHVTGRRLYLGEALAGGEGDVTMQTYEEAGFCGAQPFRYVLFLGTPPGLVPEASSLGLLLCGAGALAGHWLAARRRGLRAP